jgi:hypothetical protein
VLDLGAKANGSAGEGEHGSMGDGEMGRAGVGVFGSIGDRETLIMICQLCTYSLFPDPCLPESPYQPIHLWTCQPVYHSS